MHDMVMHMATAYTYVVYIALLCSQYLTSDLLLINVSPELHCLR